MTHGPRVLCDEMLGRLARWLRLLGVDAAYLKGRPDAEVLAAARAEDRLLLTRDEALAARAGPEALRVRALEPEAQVREVAAALGLRYDEARAMSRCTVCNGVLAGAGKAEVADEVPPSVAAAHERFWRCAACRKVYWRGTHAERIGATLRALAPPNP